MAKSRITKKKLLSEYIKSVNQIADDLEDKSIFTGRDVCDIVYRILINQNVPTTLTPDKLYVLYETKVESLNVSNKQWRENYGIPEIISLIYPIVKENQK